MLPDYWNSQRLEYNNVITYRKAKVSLQNPHVPEQPEARQLYTGMIADFTTDRVGVRADGLHGIAPLYYVLPEDIISVGAAKKVSGSQIAAILYLSFTYQLRCK